jgi:hypothetical protein
MTETYIGLARYDENGNQSGGRPGDQLQVDIPDKNGEVALVKLADFLNGGSCIIYRLIDVDKANKTGEGIVKAANNPYIGYDTTNRLDILTYGIYAGKNGKLAECDNTSLARVVIKYGTGIDVGDFNNNTVGEFLDDSDMFAEAVNYTGSEVIYIGDVLVRSSDNFVGICGYGSKRTKPTPGGVSSYNDLEDKPSINGETVEGDKSSEDYHISGGGGSRPRVSGERLVFD